jgi:alcohol dehydrogenase
MALNLLQKVGKMKSNVQNSQSCCVSADPNFEGIAPFAMSRLPSIQFGWGVRFQLLDRLLQNYRDAKLVVVTGKFLSQPGEFGDFLVQKLAGNHNEVRHFVVSGEPSPDLVDELVKQCDPQTDLVIGVGGGSVLDTAKAVAGLIPSQTSVTDYLEGVGKGLPLQGGTTPWIAVPTTAGTGSETTKNSVLSRLGEFKKSFRNEKLLAQEVWLDPAFLPSVPPKTLYATAMDALTQLLESYTTRKANPITDALAWQGLTLVKGSLEVLAESEEDDKLQAAYEHLMLAASLSGITLANAGLGAVHGLAGPIGAYFEAPHGEVCAKLLVPITQANIEVLKETKGGEPFLHKYAQVGCLLLGRSLPEAEALEALVERLQKLVEGFVPEGLAQYGLREDNLAPVINSCRAGSMLGNPVVLSDETLENAIIKAL